MSLGASAASVPNLVGALGSEAGQAPDTVPPLPPPAKSPRAQRKRLHALLDEVLNSGDRDALEAVIPSLELSVKWVRQRAHKRK
jgi:hypothetical protein